MVRIMNLQITSEGSCGSSFLGYLLAEVEIQVNEGGTSLNKTHRKYNLLFKGLNCGSETACIFTLALLTTATSPKQNNNKFCENRRKLPCTSLLVKCTTSTECEL